MSVTSVLAYTPAIASGAGEPLKNSLLMLSLEYGPVYLWLAYYCWAAQVEAVSGAAAGGAFDDWYTTRVCRMSTLAAHAVSA